MRTLALALTLAACGGTPHHATAPKGSEDLLARYQQCWTAFEANDAAWDDCYADGATSQSFGLPLQPNKAALLADHKRWRTAFPDAKYDAQVVLSSGREVFSIRWFHGTHTGVLETPLGNVPATGKSIGALIAHRVTLDAAGRVTREQIAYDLPTMMAQLGLSTDPARPVMTQGWPGAPITVVATGSPVERANAAAVKQTYELFNKRDPAFDARLADDIVETNISEPVDSTGKAALQGHNKELLGAFSNMRVDVDEVMAAGEWTLAFEHVRATNDGDFGPVKKTGKPIDVDVLELLQWNDGKAVRSIVLMNGLQLAQQLGLVPAP